VSGSKLYSGIMLRNAIRRAVPGMLLAAAIGCSDAVAPGLTVQFGRDGRHDSVRDDSLVVRTDSVWVGLSGPGADTVLWTARHAGTGGVMLLDSTRTGSGWLRWTDDPMLLAAGDYVDSLAVAVAGTGTVPAVLVDSLTVRPYPTAFVTVWRAWGPGERDSVVAHVIATRAFTFPYVGDVSDDADALIPADSMPELVPNPAFQSARQAPAGMLFSTRAQVPNGSWTVSGIRLHMVNNSQAADDYDWIGYFYYYTTDPTWHGMVIGARSGAGLNKTVDTPAFDASNAKSGAGGVEAQTSTGTWWQGNNTTGTNKVRVTASHFSGTTVTVTSGPFTGGTRTDGDMTGSLQQVVMDRMLGSAGDAADTADVTFSAIPASFYECIFPTPCTTNVLMAGNLRALLTGTVPRVRGR